MARFKHLTKDKLNNVCHHIFEIQSGLEGLGSLFEFQSGEACYSSDKLFGMGHAYETTFP